jgi:hypothetical protein
MKAIIGDQARVREPSPGQAAANAAGWSAKPAKPLVRDGEQPAPSGDELRARRARRNL